MLKYIDFIVERLNSFLWGPGTVLFMVGAGAYFTVFTSFFQLTHFNEIIKNTVGSIFQKDSLKKRKNGSITPFQAVATALAGTIGTGNIAGVATAIVSGGPGAILWMCISAFFGMMIKYAEVLLAVKYRSMNQNGEYCGGPMYYIEKALNCKPLAVVFAALCVASSFGVGNMVQSNSVADAMYGVFNIPTWVCGVAVSVVCGTVMLGGAGRISRVTEIIVPFMALFYMAGSVVFLCINAQQLPKTFLLIFNSAFNIKAAAGGAIGYTVKQAMHYGVSRGLFTNEAGLGSAPIAHASADAKSPVHQAMWGIFEVFFDTVIMCSITTLVILTADRGRLWSSGMNGATLTAAAFSSIFGKGGSAFIAVAILFFAIASILGWAFYGQRALEYLSAGSERAIYIYKVIYVILIFVGAIINVSFVWDIADALNGLMAIVNLIAILFLSREVFELTDKYRRKL